LDFTYGAASPSLFFSTSITISSIVSGESNDCVKLATGRLAKGASSDGGEGGRGRSTASARGVAGLGTAGATATGAAIARARAGARATGVAGLDAARAGDRAAGAAIGARPIGVPDLESMTDPGTGARGDIGLLGIF
jgi:hypothetical protein